jgi:flagellar biosynthesis/type III secretory pathway M-ring protein FliF/YscJ
MLPENGISNILDVVKNLFTGIKPVVFLYLGVILAFIILEQVIEMYFKRAEAEKEAKIQDERISERILGSGVLKDIQELDFIAKKRGYILQEGWQEKIKTTIYDTEFSRLTKKYNLHFGIKPKDKT